MESFESVRADATAFVLAARDLVGTAVYEPLGIETSDAANLATLGVLALGLLIVIRRICRPAYHPRHRYHPSDYDFGRDH